MRFEELLEDARISRHRYDGRRPIAATLLAFQGSHSKAIQSLLGRDQAARVCRYA